MDAVVMQEVRALIFDTFGTLVDWRGSLVADLSAWGAQRGLNVDWPALADAWRAAYRPSMDRVRRGERPWTRLDDLHRASLEALAPRFGLANLEQADLDHVNHVWHRLQGWPDTTPGLYRLKRRFVIAPLSNGNVSLLVDMAKASDLPWDTVFGSDVFRHYKPDPETYLGACDLLSLPASRVLMVAAHNGDLAAARALGLRTAFIPRPQEHGPGQTTDLRAESDWDVVAGSVEELADRLGA